MCQSACTTRLSGLIACVLPRYAPRCMGACTTCADTRSWHKFSCGSEAMTHWAGSVVITSVVLVSDENNPDLQAVFFCWPLSSHV
jgi:hypothetical protein